MNKPVKRVGGGRGGGSLLHTQHHMNLQRNFRQKLARQQSCRCSNSGCVKNYCPCFKRGLGCGGFCKCTGCKNLKIGTQKQQAQFKTPEQTGEKVGKAKKRAISREKRAARAKSGLKKGGKVAGMKRTRKNLFQDQGNKGERSGKGVKGEGICLKKHARGVEV